MKRWKRAVLLGAVLCILLLAWFVMVLYMVSAQRATGESIAEYFLSAEQGGIKFRALIAAVPLLLAAFGCLVYERSRLAGRTRTVEGELKQWAVDLERANELLTRQVFYDSLTNLPNRALFMDRLGNSLERRKRYEDHSFAVLFIDLDRFKVINDSLGHVFGDQLLVMVAQRLRRHLRSIDTIARFGGDEFVILMDDARETYVNEITDRIQGEMAAPFSVFGHEIFVTMSMGVVFSNMGDYKKPDELLRDADTAMYQAKARGKACYVVFDSKMHTEATMTLMLETQLRRALDRGEFTVYYQPIISVAENKIAGFEALLRWQHPERGLVTPSEFIVVAEETGLIFSLGQWVIQEACRQLKAWQERFPSSRSMTVSVNVSSKVFAQPNFYGIVEKILQESGLDGSCLRLEIVERMLIEDPEPAAELITRLNGLKVRFDIDDFGTGYSALNYLRHLPIKGLKIDGSFIKSLTFDINNAKIVNTIVALGKDLGLDVIAEGIESNEQLTIFKGMKGEYAQGFYLFRPMDHEAAGSLLAARGV